MIIGLTGHSGAHKTQVAKRLQKAYGFARLHAGRPVKRATRAAFGLTKAQTSGFLRDSSTARLGGAAPRDAMEATGEAFHRELPNATSVEMTRRVNKRLGAGKEHVVVDGVRSPVEADAIRRMGGMVVRADNGGAADSAKPMDALQATIDKVDYTIDTSGGRKDTRAKTDAMVSDMSKWQSTSADLHKPRMPR